MSQHQGRQREAKGDTPDRRHRRARGTHRAIQSIKAEHARDRTRLEIGADWLTRMSSSPVFLALHVLWFSFWIFWNVGFLGFRPFDPFPFGLLTMIVSLEAIFLSIFVLMSQGRDAQIAELREEITLQVILRTEEELTKTLHLVAGLYGRLGHEIANDPELDEMLAPLDAEDIEHQLARQIQEARLGPPKPGSS